MPFRDVVGTSITGVHAWDDDAAVLAPDIARARQPLLCPYEFPDDFLGYHDILNFVRILQRCFYGYPVTVCRRSCNGTSCEQKRRNCKFGRINGVDGWMDLIY